MQADDGTAASSNTSKGKSVEKERKHHTENKTHGKKHSAKRSKTESKSKSKKSRSSKGKRKGSSRKHKHKPEGDTKSKSKSVKERGERGTLNSKDLPEPESAAGTSPSLSRRRKHRRKSSKQAPLPSSTSSRKRKKTSVFRKIYRKLAGPKKKKGRKEKSRKKPEEQISPTKRSETESTRSLKKTRAGSKDETKVASHDKERDVVAKTGSPKKKGTGENEKNGAPGTAEVAFTVSEDQAAKTMAAKDVADMGKKVGAEGAEMTPSTAAESTSEAPEQKGLLEVVTSPKKSAMAESKPETRESKGKVDRQVSSESTSKQEAMPAAPDKMKRGAMAGTMGPRKLFDEKPPSAAPSAESIITPEKIPIKEEKRESRGTEATITSFICPETRSKHDGVVAVDWQSLQAILFAEY